jgi:hypothetical protein
MSTDEDAGRVLTPEARLFHPHLFEPRTEVNGKKLKDPKYEAQLIFDPNQIEALKAAAVVVARAKWPTVDLKTLKWPFKSGSVINQKREGKGKKPYPQIEGMVVMTTKSSAEFKPQVIDAKGQEIVNPTLVYGGCYGYAEVKLIAYEGNDDDIKPGVTAYINMFLKSRDGDRIGGRDAKATFAGIIGKLSAEDPTKGVDADETGLPF